MANVADLLASGTAHKVRLVQGSHIVVPKLFAHDRAYLFQNPDGRVVFAIPYEGDFTLIGTTDRDFVGNPAAATISGEEIDYLCETASACFAQPVRPSDVVWSYCGVRPLYDDGAGEAQAASREYVLEMDETPGSPPLLAIIGGKITTYRRLAEAALERLAPHLPERQGLAAGWTGRQPLPGGDFDLDGLRRAGSCAGSRLPVPGRRPCAPPGARLRQGGLARARQGRGRRRPRPVASAPRSRKRRCATSSRRNGRAPPTTWSGAAPSSGCA